MRSSAPASEMHHKPFRLQDPLKVVAARKLEMEYARKKPAWEKIPRHAAKMNGWKSEPQ